MSAQKIYLNITPNAKQATFVRSNDQEVARFRHQIWNAPEAWKATYAKLKRRKKHTLSETLGGIRLQFAG